MRFLFIALAITAMLFTVLESLNALRPDTQSILVAAHDIDAGTKLDAHDVVQHDVPRSFVPKNTATSLKDITGEKISAFLPQGMPISRSMFVNSDFLNNAPQGQSIVPISSFTSSDMNLLEAGQKVCLYAPPRDNGDDEESRLLVNGGTILAITPAESGGSILSPSQTSNGTLLLAIKTDDVSHVLGYSSHSPLQITLCP